MAKRFKLRISRVILSCRSKDPSTLPEDPVPSLRRLSPINPKPKPGLIIDVEFPPVPPPSKPHRSSFRRHVSSAFISVGCSFKSKSTHYSSVYGAACSPEFQWQKEEKWHVVAKVYDETPCREMHNTSASDDDGIRPPARPPPITAGKKKRRSKKKTTTRPRNSTSSVDSGLFSSEAGDERDDGETTTLVSSSLSLSTDSSSEFNPQLKTILETPTSRRQKKKKKKAANRTKRCVSKSAGGDDNNSSKVKILRRSSVSSPEAQSPARLSMFKKLIPCAVEGKVRESFAVVKKSEDPYEDFKRSMMEMILEKQMFEQRDLEQLLQCFLSLNSRHHHEVIVEAFSEIWEAMFCRNASTRQIAA